MSQTNTPEPTETTERKPRGPLVLARPVKNSIAGSTVVKATRSRQIHVLPSDASVTLCGINTERWAEQVDVDADAKVTCPLCGKAMKAAAKEAATAGADSAVDES